MTPTTVLTGAWVERLASDARLIDDRLPGRLVPLHLAVVARAVEVQADSLILSGSTARGFRTEISDLDYHLIGPSIDVSGLSRELDIHVLSEEELVSHVLEGDDFVHWSLRYGLVVFDRGPVRSARALLERKRPWPDAARKRTQARKSLNLARRFVASGDYDAAMEQVRTALSLTARAYLLTRGIFPLSRAELPAQLELVDGELLGAALAETIDGAPSMARLETAVDCGSQLLDSR